LTTHIQTLLFLSYLGMLFIRFRRPLPSISESWYQLGRQKHLFTLFCVLVGMLMFFQTDGSTGFYFMSGVGLCFTGVAAEFRSRAAHTNIVHYVGAVMFMLGGLLGLYFESGLLWPLVLTILGILTLSFFKARNLIFWAEIWAGVLILSGLYMR